MQGPYTISIWYASLDDLTTFNEKYMMGDRLVTLLRDTQMQHSFWGVYRVTGDQLGMLRKIPRLTWK